MELLNHFEEALRAHSLVRAGQRVLVAFSGGADSTALLHLFFRLREPWSLELAAAHLNHALRGEQSDNDEAHCRRVCAEWRIPCFTRRTEVLPLARERRLSIEMAARVARYAFLEEVADTIEADVIALGHTRDDQVETILLHLTRGTGTAGLAGMPRRRDRLIRPLLGFSRKQVRDYCLAHHLPFVEDASNLDLRYGRNRIRHRVLPELRRLNPRVDEALERLSVTMRDEEIWWQQYLQAREPEFTLRRTEQEWRLSLEWLRAQPDALVRRVVRYAAEAFCPEGAELHFAQVERLREAIRTGSRASVTLSGTSVHLAVVPGALRVWRKPDTVSTSYEMMVQIPGTTPVPLAGVTLHAECSTLPEGGQWRRENWEVWCDAAQVEGQLIVRNWRPGDRVQPLGMTGHRKLSDIFTDRKVPSALRRQIPVVCDAQGIIWVVGICLAHRVRCTPQTNEVLHLWVEPLGQW